MRLSQVEQINNELYQVTDNMAGVLSLTPEFIDRWAPRITIVPMTLSEDGRFSINFENGEPVGDNQPYTQSDIVQLQDYDGDLVAAGMERYASYEARARWYVESIEAGPNPSQRLTGSLIGSIGAAKRIGTTGAEQLSRLDKKHQKLIASRTLRLVHVLVAGLVDCPSAVILPVESPTQQQAEAIEGLLPYVNGRSWRDLRVRASSIVDRLDNLPTIDVDAWQDKLRRIGLNWLSKEEYLARKEFLSGIFSRQFHL